MLVTAKLLCDNMIHDASGLPHNVGNIYLVRVVVVYDKIVTVLTFSVLQPNSYCMYISLHA